MHVHLQDNFLRRRRRWRAVLGFLHRHCRSLLFLCFRRLFRLFLFLSTFLSLLGLLLFRLLIFLKKPTEITKFNNLFLQLHASIDGNTKRVCIYAYLSHLDFSGHREMGWLRDNRNRIRSSTTAELKEMISLQCL